MRVIKKEAARIMPPEFSFGFVRDDVASICLISSSHASTNTTGLEKGECAKTFLTRTPK
jgi:hypothetical protein